jgi:hypothetical protein
MFDHHRWSWPAVLEASLAGIGPRLSAGMAWPVGRSAQLIAQMVDDESDDTAWRPISRRRGDSVAIGRVACRLEVINRHYGIVRVELIGTEPRSPTRGVVRDPWLVCGVNRSTVDVAADEWSRRDGSAAY